MSTPAPAAEQSAADTDQAEPDRPREKLGRLAKAARRIATHLSPVAKAEAAPIPRQLRAPPESDRWSIQLGTFRVESAAEQAARSAADGPRGAGQTSADRAAIKGRKGPFLPRPPAQLFAAGSAGRLCRAPQKEDRLLRGPAEPGQSRQPVTRPPKGPHPPRSVHPLASRPELRERRPAAAWWGLSRQFGHAARGKFAPLIPA